MSSQPTTAPVSFSQQLGTAWNAFWFLPADGRPLAVIRILTAVLGLVLWSSYAADLQRWFGPEGIVSPEVMATWRRAYGVSLFDAATTAASLWALYGLGFAAFASLLVGLGTPIAAPLAAVLWVSILHRGPMLISPADDVLAILLWCLVIGRSGDHLSLDARLRRARGGAEAVPSVRNRLALSLINRKQVGPGGFEESDSGAVRMDNKTRRAVIAAYQKRKLRTVTHPFLNEKTTIGLIVHLQARLLARQLRGELDSYPPFLWK